MRRSRESDRNEVATPDAFLMSGVPGDVPFRGSQRLHRLARRNRIFGTTRPFATSGLDLDEDELVPVQHDQVELTRGAVPVAGHETVSEAFEERLSQALPIPSEVSRSGISGHGNRAGRGVPVRSWIGGGRLVRIRR